MPIFSIGTTIVYNRFEHALNGASVPTEEGRHIYARDEIGKEFFDVMMVGKQPVLTLDLQMVRWEMQARRI